jgi:hypothetical protein
MRFGDSLKTTLEVASAEDRRSTWSITQRELRPPVPRIAGTAADGVHGKSRRAGDVLAAAHVPRIDSKLPSSAGWREPSAEVNEPIRCLRLDRVVECGEEHAALPGHVAAQRERPGVSYCDVVDDRLASGPFRCIVQPVARRILRERSTQRRAGASVPGT